MPTHTEDEATFKCATTTLLQALWPGVFIALRIAVPFSARGSFCESSSPVQYSSPVVQSNSPVH